MDELNERFERLCHELNLDKNTADEAMHSFKRALSYYSLEGDNLHWLVCALYVACRREIPTVGSGQTDSNGVSLTQLLRHSSLSLLEFFNKIQKWQNMSSVPDKICQKIKQLEDRFKITANVFKKFLPIFTELFNCPTNMCGDVELHNQSSMQLLNMRKMRRQAPPCNVLNIFVFSWTLYVLIKSKLPTVCADLLNSYHLMLCCLEWLVTEVIRLGGDRALELLNENAFKKVALMPDELGLARRTEGAMASSTPRQRSVGGAANASTSSVAFKDTLSTLHELLVQQSTSAQSPPSTVPSGAGRYVDDYVQSVLEAQLQKYGGLRNELAYMRSYFWQKRLGRLAADGLLSAAGENDSNGALAAAKFWSNFKSVSSEYDEFVLTKGDLDERLFLGPDADREIGRNSSPCRAANGFTLEEVASFANSLGRVGAKEVVPVRHYTPYSKAFARRDAPLTPRRAPTVEPNRSSVLDTPVSSAMNMAFRLRSLMIDSQPGEDLLQLIRDTCSRFDLHQLESRVERFGDQFQSAFCHTDIDQSPLKSTSDQLPTQSEAAFRNSDSSKASPQKMRTRSSSRRSTASPTVADESLCTGVVMQPLASPAATDTDSLKEFARRRFEFARSLYYSSLEQILLNEKRKLLRQNNVDHMSVAALANHVAPSIEALLEHDLFHRCLFACAIEVVLGARNPDKAFPWILDAFRIDEFSFLKVIELFIRAQPHLHAASIRHLHAVEDRILEELVWRGESSLWSMLPDGEAVPACDEVFPSSRLDSSLGPLSADTSTGPNTSVAGPDTSAAANGPSTPQPDDVGRMSSLSLMQSPVSTRCGLSRNGTPMSARRALFGNATNDAPPQTPVTPDAAVALANRSGASWLRSDGGNRSISVAEAAAQSSVSQTPSRLEGAEGDAPVRPLRRSGQLTIFFRKFYQLASARLRQLCDHLHLSAAQLDTLPRQAWTAFEWAIVHCPRLLADRHIDTVVMCALLLAAKATAVPVDFIEIIRAYRHLPSVNSSVYRNVRLDEAESRGDISAFYNVCFLSEIEEFVQLFVASFGSDVSRLVDSGEVGSGEATPTKAKRSRVVGGVRSGRTPPGGAEASGDKRLRLQLSPMPLRYPERQVRGDQLAAIPAADRHRLLASPIRLTPHRNLYLSPSKLLSADCRAPQPPADGGESPSGAVRAQLKPQQPQPLRLSYIVDRSPRKTLSSINSAMTQYQQLALQAAAKRKQLVAAGERTDPTDPSCGGQSQRTNVDNANASGAVGVTTAASSGSALARKNLTSMMMAAGEPSKKARSDDATADDVAAGASDSSRSCAVRELLTDGRYFPAAIEMLVTAAQFVNADSTTDTRHSNDAAQSPRTP